MFSWLKYIYQRVTTILEISSRTDRRLNELTALVSDLVTSQGRIEGIVLENNKILKELQDQENPDQAVSVNLQAGPIEEQP